MLFITAAVAQTTGSQSGGKIQLTAGERITIVPNGNNYTIVADKQQECNLLFRVAGQYLSITDSCGTIDVPLSAINTIDRILAGNCIGVSVSGGDVTISNTCPDQTVTLTGAGNTTVTGNYPNFTVTTHALADNGLSIVDDTIHLGGHLHMDTNIDTKRYNLTQTVADTMGNSIIEGLYYHNPQFAAYYPNFAVKQAALTTPTAEISETWFADTNGDAPTIEWRANHLSENSKVELKPSQIRLISNGTVQVNAATKLEVMPPNNATASAGDVLTLMPNGETLWQPSPIYDGSETKVVAGTNASITGTGTVSDPYIVTNTAPDVPITTNTLTKPTTNTIQSTVNGVSSATQPIIATNTLAWNSTTGLLTSTLNGVAGTATIPRVSQAFPLQNGINDTRTGAIGTAGTNIFAAWDHQHPIIRIANIPTMPNIAVTGLGTFNSQSVITSRSTEETISFVVLLTWTSNAIGTWATISLPTIAGYTLTESSASTYDATGGGLNTSRMMSGVTNYANPQTFYAQTTVSGRQFLTTFQLTYELN